MLELLIYLHKLNLPIITQDIKPSNILFVNHPGNYMGQIYLIYFA
ncbi:hypothetical protein RINTHM_13560 [Richelia intracellularis HM01]|nr:hypothetical protein RINTHM_13560 [Richelia intracellularis HM01]